MLFFNQRSKQGVEMKFSGFLVAALCAIFGWASQAHAQQGFGTTTGVLPFFYSAPDGTTQPLMTITAAGVLNPFTNQINSNAITYINGTLQVNGSTTYGAGNAEFTSWVSAQNGFLAGPTPAQADTISSSAMPVSVCQNGWTCLNGYDPSGATTGWAQFGGNVGIMTSPNQQYALNVGGTVNATGYMVTNSGGSASLDFGGVTTVNSLESLYNICPAGSYVVSTGTQGVYTCQNSSGVVVNNTSVNNNTGSNSVITVGPPPAPQCIVGSLWFNTNTNVLEVCSGSIWQIVLTKAPNGYVVLSAGVYDGNRGGLTGANSTCLTDLTTNTNWNGYSTAMSYGQLIPTKVRALMCSTTECNVLVPSTTYYYGNAADPTAGGASFTTDASGYGPGDNSNWSDQQHFNTSTTYYTGWDVGPLSTTLPYETNSNAGAATCNNWTMNKINQGLFGVSNSTGYTRWSSNSSMPTNRIFCNNQLHLVCVVNP
jgi:hypothetical protein